MPIANELHNRITGFDAIHQTYFIGATDPASDPANDVQAYANWIDTTTGTNFSTGWLHKQRNAGNTAWVTVLDLKTALDLKAALASPTFTGTPAVPDDPYDATTWNGSTGIPTKNAIRDKIESLAAGSYTDEQAQDAVGTILTDSATIDFTYTDATPAIAASVIDGSITGTKIASSVALAGSPTTTTQTAGDNSGKISTTGYADNAVAKQPEVLIIAISDETTSITTGTAKATFRMPFAMTVTAVRASLNTVSSSGIPTFDINESGTTILSTKLTIDAGEFTSTTAATPAVISDASLADDAEITIDIDVAGTGAKGAKIAIIGMRT